LASAGSQALTEPVSHSLYPSVGCGQTTGRTEAKKLIGQNKHREITYQLLSWAKEIQPVESNSIHCQLA